MASKGGFQIIPLSGWGRHPVQMGRLYRPERYSELVTHSGILARGMGRSYGDSALNEGGELISMLRLNRLLAFDPESGLLVAQAGATLAEITETTLPQGWFLPVTPGTKFVTLGGAFASDVHGKNHHRDGSFSHHVAWLDLFTPAMGKVRCSPEENVDLFWATAGGQGLTGTIGCLAVRLRKVTSSWLEVRHQPGTCLEEGVGLLQSSEAPYSVAWIDCLARGRNMGRCVLMEGRHLEAGERPLPPSKPFPVQPSLGLPCDLPSFMMNEHSIKAFNQIYYVSQARKTQPYLSALDPFFYPLDKVGNWNRAYGKSGLVQYQCLLPETETLAGISRLLSLISKAGAASFLAVLKRLGPSSSGPLSFPFPGFTLALDLQFRGPETIGLFAQLDEVVLRHSGRINLCKDAHLDATTFRVMYPRFKEWQAIKKKVDPLWILHSSQSRRLRMEEE